MEIRDGTAVTIAGAITKLCIDLDLNAPLFLWLGSDGASVMLGRRGSLSKLLRDKVPSSFEPLHCPLARISLWSGS